MKELERFSVGTLISIIIGVMIMVFVDIFFGYLSIITGILISFIFNPPK